MSATRKELEAYIGVKAKQPYFKKALDKFMENPNKPIWCWTALFPNMFWLCYRKCLTPSILLMVAFFTSNLLIPIQYSTFIIIGIFLLSGLFGMNIYLVSAEKEIARIKDNNSMANKKQILDLISKKGGVSLNYALTFYVVQVLLYSTIFRVAM